jgi:hypothetical protein
MNGGGKLGLALLRRRAERACGGAPINAAFAKMRQIIGPSVFPQGEELAAAGMAKLKAGGVPSPMERTALETVIKALRPSILSQGGDLAALPPYRNYPEQFLSEWTIFRAVVMPYLYSIGRIDRLTKPSYEPLATGFLIGKNALVTNKHVLAALSADTFQLERGQAVVRFGQEWGTPDAFDPVAITGVLAVHTELDMVVLEIEENSRPPLAVASVTPPAETEVVAIGYPQDDPRSPVFRDVIFEGKYKVKRAAPGEITGAGVASLYHDCSTLGGNSGSPLLAIANAHVVGLHRDGPLFLYRNEAVDAASLYAFVQPYVQ